MPAIAVGREDRAAVTELSFEKLLWLSRPQLSSPVLDRHGPDLKVGGAGHAVFFKIRQALAIRRKGPCCLKIFALPEHLRLAGSIRAGAEDTAAWGIEEDLPAVRAPNWIHLEPAER
jgi:hypothetical protein